MNIMNTLQLHNNKLERLKQVVIDVPTALR